MTVSQISMILFTAQFARFRYVCNWCDNYFTAIVAFFDNLLVNKCLLTLCFVFSVYYIEQNGYPVHASHSLSYLTLCEKKFGDPHSRTMHVKTQKSDFSQSVILNILTTVFIDHWPITNSQIFSISLTKFSTI